MKIGIRTWILIIAILLSLLAIKPSFDSGVVVKSVEINSSIANAGLKAGEIIKSVNGIEIGDKKDYADAISSL